MSATESDTAAAGGWNRAKRTSTQAVRAITRGPRTWFPAVFFVFDILVLVLLLLLSPFHHFSSGILPGFTNTYPVLLPPIVPWAGALGGVSISIVGVAGHSLPSEWRAERFAYWHLTRPFLGAMFGTTAVLIITLLIRSVQGPDSTNTVQSNSGQLTLGVIAFVVGFREETFRELVMRVVDMIIQPGGAGAAARIVLVPDLLDFQQAPVGETVTKSLNLMNTGSETLTIPAKSIRSSSDGIQLIGNDDDQTLSPGGALSITVKWTPTRSGRLEGTITANVKAASATAFLRVTAG